MACIGHQPQCDPTTLFLHPGLEPPCNDFYASQGSKICERDKYLCSITCCFNTQNLVIVR